MPKFTILRRQHAAFSWMERDNVLWIPGYRVRDAYVMQHRRTLLLLNSYARSPSEEEDSNDSSAHISICIGRILITEKQECSLLVS